MGSTKRSQNKCGSCGYTWYPRGKNRSLKCPNCGSSSVSIVGGGGLLVGILIVGWLVFGGESKVPDAPAQEASVPPSAIQNARTPLAAPEKTAAPVEQEVAVSASSPEATASSVNDVSANDRVERSARTPTKVCNGESNFFSWNNCMWRECEKPEFADLQECENKKPNRNTSGG
jgi:hypothetical protein